MSYTVRLYDAEEGDGAVRVAAQRRFKQVLDETIGDAALVMPVYLAYRRIIGEYGDSPDLSALTDAEREIVQQWQAAEDAAIRAVFGPLRSMGDGLYELKA